MTDKFWLEVRRPGRVPRRGGPFAMDSAAPVLRDWMDAYPDAFITVVTVDEDGTPDFADAPETLQMLDGRSMSRGRRHIVTSRAAHANAGGPDAA